jgi:hypothetical protein
MLALGALAIANHATLAVVAEVLVAMVRAMVAVLVMSATAGHNGRRAGGGCGASYGGHVVQWLIM